MIQILFIICLLCSSVIKAAQKTVVVFQNGRNLSAGVYNLQINTEISTQYIASWNFNNGQTYYGGESLSISENPDNIFRILLKFGGINTIIPNGAFISSARLTLSFANWATATTVQACFMTRPWDQAQPLQRYQGTGWAFSKWNASSSSSVSWTQPGGWLDCDRRVNMSNPVPAGGNVTRTINLDAGLVRQWVANPDSQNFGLLLRASGSTFLTMYANSAGTIYRRPSLEISFSAASSPSPPPSSYPVVYAGGGRTIWVNAVAGDDLVGSGDAVFPVKSLRRALVDAVAGDSIYLMNGTYPGGVSLTASNIIIQSAPGHWAVISSPLNDPIDTNNVIIIRPTAQSGVIRNVEITGGWGNYATVADNVNIAKAASNFLIENVRIHHTGSSCVKMVMKVSNVTFRNSEIHNCGERYRNYGHGVEGVQVRHLTVQDCYIHDLPGAGIHLIASSSNARILRNFISNVNFGMNIGFTAEYDLFDTINNPNLFENLNAVVANNIISVTLDAGINLWAAYNATIAYNTIWNAQETAQSAILIDSYQHIDAPKAPIRGCSRLLIVGNILTKSKSARVGPLLSIRADGFNNSSPLIVAQNIFYDFNGIAGPFWQWNKGAMFEVDQTSFVGNISMWKSYCMVTMGQSLCDSHSLEANPMLDIDFSPLPCSPAVGLLATALLNTKVSTMLSSTDFKVDFNGVLCSGLQGAGAVSTLNTSITARKPIPPVPAGLWNAPPPYRGPSLPAYFYDTWTWPFAFWLQRTCVDIYVDAVLGTDQQSFNYLSNYTRPFKTIMGALISINQCDRVLLKGNQVHRGHIGIYRPNVTIMTDPRDSIRATVLCEDVGSSPCLITGEGFYDGAAEVTLYNFNMIMTGASSSTCIQLNEGYGGAYSPYWKFYIESAGRQQFSKGHTLISDMDISGCTRSGLKLSTFVTGVLLTNLHIRSVNNSGIEMRNGNNVTIRNCVIENVGGSGIVMGGGSKNNIVAFNTIRNFGDRGILVGSDNTEVQYMDTEFAMKYGWYDAFNCTIQNNVIIHGLNSGLAFYSAKDIVAVQNTILDVGQQGQAAILLNLSPKLLNNTYQVLVANRNITLANNVITLSNYLPSSNLPMIENRVMQVTVRNIQLPPRFPSAAVGNCSMALTMNRLLFATEESRQAVQRRGLSTPQIRNVDGSCKQFPDNNPWHLDVRSLPIHPNSASIRTLIRAGGTLHPDFGGGSTVLNNQNVHMFVPYGIPITTVNTKPLNKMPGQPLVPLTVSPTGYASECDYPLIYPFPRNASIEGAYLNCPDSACPGDRHVLVIDNSTCMLYESWRSFGPGTTGQGWLVDIAVKFDLGSNALRPLGYSSSDAAGLPVTAGLVQFNEVINKGVIDHALRFTGPNSRAAYVLPATHFAPTGDTGPDSPWMGMRVRLNPAFDCTQLARAARIFCVALQTYGGIFADNGSPWYFSGEATTQWLPYVNELQDIGKIPASMIDILDTGCICLDSGCSITECSNGVHDPNALPVWPAVDSNSNLKFSHNFYYNMNGRAGRYVDRRTGYLGKGYDGPLVGWQKFSNGDNVSVEINPNVDYSSYHLLPGSPAILAVPLSPSAAVDIFGGKVPSVGGKVNAGVLFANYTLHPSAAPSAWPTKKPTTRPTIAPSFPSSYSPTVLPSVAPSAASPTAIPIKTMKPSTAVPSVDPSWRTVQFQSGRKIGSSFYNYSYDVEITSMYSTASYHNYNGLAYFYGSSQTYYVANGTNHYRMLLRFDNLTHFLPSSVGIVKSSLTLTVANWVTTAIKVCALAKPWDSKLIIADYGTWWRLNRWIRAGNSTWTKPGAIADCYPDSTSSVITLGSGSAVSVSVPLPPGILSQWHTSGGKQNFGLLIWAVTGSTSVCTSSNVKPDLRPQLLVTYSSSKLSNVSSATPSIAPSVTVASPISFSPSLSLSPSPTQKAVDTSSSNPSTRPPWTLTPSASPSYGPTSCTPSANPSNGPTSCTSSANPSQNPSFPSTKWPTVSPSTNPLSSPSKGPTNLPTSIPSIKPSPSPSYGPTIQPSYPPSTNPLSSPSKGPTNLPTSIPSIKPSPSPSYGPTIQPSYPPSARPSPSPSYGPTSRPTSSPSYGPTKGPSYPPSVKPSALPTARPSASPSTKGKKQ